MLRGPLHNASPDGLCEACGEPFPCPTGIAIFESVVRLNRLHITVNGRALYEREWERYRELYPDVEALEPKQDELRLPQQTERAP